MKKNFINLITKFLLLILILHLSIFSADFYQKGNTKEKVVALSFDDGPDPDDTPKLLDFLKENEIKATFFLIGENVVKYPKIAERIKKEGHLILNHTYAHSDFTYQDKKQIEKEIIDGDNAIEKVLKIEPKIYRPPYGVITKAEIKAAKELGMTPVIWNIDTKDWSKEATKQTIIDCIDNNITPGSIILMHTQPHNFKSLEALQTIVPKLREQGYKFITIDKMINVEPYLIDKTK